jgi:hypothetical protein
MSTTPTIHVETEKWMKSVKDKTDGTLGYLIGSVKDMKDIFAVTLPSLHGGTRFYCGIHERIFPIQERCPDCAASTGH